MEEQSKASSSLLDECLDGGHSKWQVKLPARGSQRAMRELSVCAIGSAFEGEEEEAAAAAATTTTATAATGSLVANNGVACQQLGNNSLSESASKSKSNGYHATRGNNKSSYSKIFRQYLPRSLNLNYTLNYYNSKSGQANGNYKSKSSPTTSEGNEKIESKSELVSRNARQSLATKGWQPDKSEVARETLETSELAQSSQLTCAKVATKSNGEQRLLFSRGRSQLLCNEGREQSKSIVSALNRFKISPAQSSSCKRANKCNKNQNQNENEYEHEGDNNDFQRQRQTSNESSLFANSREASESAKVKRRGFLYLKGGNKSSKLEEAHLKLSTSADHEQRFSSKSANVIRRHNHQANEKRRISNAKRRDLNNNSISCLLNSSCHLDDREHTACLLEEEDVDDDNDNEHYNYKDSIEFFKSQEQLKGCLSNKEKPRKDQESAKEVPSLNSNSKSATKKDTESKMFKQQASPRSKSPRSALALAAGLVTLSLLLLFASLGVLPGGLALAQHQHQHQHPQQLAPLQSSGAAPVGGADIVRQVSPPSSSASVSGAQRPAPQPAAGSLVANINCNKIRGHVTLTPNLQGGTTVSTQISAGPPGEVYQWSVHQFPVKPGAAMCSCSALILGVKLIDLSEMHGNLPSDQEFSVQSSLSLFGADSPVGHSLLLRGMKTGMVACATFLPTSRKSNYRAKFHTPLSGSVTIFQTAFGTSFISHLMYSNGTRRHSMHRFDLVKSEDDVVTSSLLSGAVPFVGSAGARSSPSSSGQTDNAAASAHQQLEQREHEHELSQCRGFAGGEPLFKNLTYQLSVSTENFGMRGRTSLVLPHIPFETFSSVYVVVYSEHDPSEPMACAPLRFVKPKTAAAKFQTVSVQGSVVFSQDSPYDVTVARVNLQLPNSDGHSYGIDELPMIIRRKSDTRVCPNIREIIYNPNHVEPSSVPPEGEATSDQYAVGDLSGKYGSLAGKASEKIQVNDYNLPLFGPTSIVGRALTIYSAEGVAIACSNVELTAPMTTAFATFDFGIQGQFIFRQPQNDCNGDTYVYIEVSKPTNVGGSSANSNSNNLDTFRSLDHNWHIHVNPVDSGLDHLSTTDCLPAGGHYNPYNTSTSSIYTRDCTPFNVLRCELGDLSAKMFTIEIPPYRVKGGQEPDIGKFFGTDIDLPLCGPVSIVNRSVVVHVQDFGMQRLACSTVIEFKPRTS